MDVKGLVNKRPSDVFVLSLALLVAGVALLALFGWVYKAPQWASFRVNLIPMAPSTAALFLLFGAAIGLRVMVPSNRYTLWFGTVVGCGGILIALFLFGMAFMDIHVAVEHLGLDITGTFQGAPIGHMSAVTAIGFVLSGLALLASLFPAERSFRGGFMALGFAGLLLGMCLVFLLAYLFGTPLLYGGKFIPPAINTLLAFVLWSFALMIFVWYSPGFQARRTEGGLETFILLLSVFVLLVGGLITLGSVMGIVLFGAGVSVGLIWWRQRNRFYRERVGAIDALQKSEDKFRAIANYTVDWESWFGVDGKYLWVNPAVEQITGYSSEEILAMPDFVSVLIAEEDRAVFAERFQDALRGIRGKDFDFRYVHKNGAKYWLSASWQPIFDAKGNPLGVRASGRDITKRKLSEAALQESERRYHSLIFNMTEGVALHEMVYAEDGKAVNYRIIEVNPAFERHTGIKAEDACGLLASEVYQIGAAPYLEIYDRVARTGVPYFFESGIPLLRRNFSVSAYSPRTGWFATVFTDITQRVKTEESHARLATAVEQAAETIVITDAQGTILYANPAFEKTTGYTREEAIGQNPRILKSGKHDGMFYIRMWEVLNAGNVWTGRISNKRKDGTLYEEDASISPVFDSAGKIVNFVGVKRDITREVQLEEQFLQSQKMEAIGRLAGGVAHDFNNILAVIMMNGSELMDDTAITPSQSESIIEIIKAAERGANLTRQMLAFSRRQVMQLRALDLNDVVLGVIKMLQRLIGEDIVLQTRLSDADVLVWGDAGMIEQVLMNLAVNARDAMVDGGQISIELCGMHVDGDRAAGHKVAPGDYVRLTVRDNGSGISPENLPHIFEPFYTTKVAGKGTGLGLATLHGIVEQHQGWVEVESQVGQGTSFHVFLPRLSASQRLRVDQKPEAVVVAGGLETILLVEDESSLRALALRILKHYGYRVLEAKNGVEALHAWRQHSREVDLLLTDMIMPEGISGGKLSQQLLAEKPELKVIYMSGYPGEVTESGLDLREGRKFLQKPFSPGKLVQTVRESLDAV